MVQFKFTKKEPPRQMGGRNPNWRILVVDNDPEVHAATRLALKELQFAGRGIEILSASSAAQAHTALEAEDDIALVLLDAVMERGGAGLLQYIRNELKNATVRIILRTGQAGQTPEAELIVSYDINDCKAKTELTVQKLFATTVTALRAYDYLCALDSQRRGLQQIIENADALFREHSLQRFASGILIQLGTFLDVGANGILCVQSTESCSAGERMQLLAASNPDWLGPGQNWQTSGMAPEVRELILATFDRKKNQYGASHTALYLGREDGQAVVACLHCPPPEDPARSLIELFCAKIAIGFGNVRLYEQLNQANALLEQKVEARTYRLAKANQKLAYLATTDALTGISNRRHFLDELGLMSTEAVAQREPFCVVMLDIDHFKEVNDNHGHAAGDGVLQVVAQRLGHGLRDIDRIARIGGEEFAILLPCSTVSEALVVAERLRARIAESPVEIGRASVPVTVSLGIAQAAAGATAERLLSLADNALTCAKNSGRNRVCCAPLAAPSPGAALVSAA
ncbi:MAG TPA: diguanylate cyclase [Burkholderiaceae bacterium]|nr:diguanylate cyclase [Burkholderiaceae bacterium]